MACKRAGTSTEITSTMVNMQMKTTFFKEIPTLIPQEKLPYARKLVKRLFLLGQLPNVQIAGRLKHFAEKRKLLTKDHSILEIVKGHQIPFLSQPLQQQLSREIHLNLKKICNGGRDWKSLDHLTGDGVFGFDNKFRRDDYPSSRRETLKSEITMFRFVSEPTSVNFTIDEGVTTSYVENPDCPSSTTEQSFPSATAE